MKRVWIDFETFYDADYSLKKLTPIEYILDPRFEALGCGFVSADGAQQWIDGPDLEAHFRTIDWPQTCAVSHNALFDMLILSLRYGVIPGRYGDTLSMSRNWLSHLLPSVSLASVAEHYGMLAKWNTVNKLKGVSFAALRGNPALYQETQNYALDDAAKCKMIYQKIRDAGFPENELRVIDLVVRMVTLPQLELDATRLAEHCAQTKAKKQQLLDAAFLDDAKSIMSDQQLAARLRMLGVGPMPMKASKTTRKPAFAFAKTDRAFTDLLKHEDPDVQALVAARLSHKSTLEETRTQRLLQIAKLTSLMPVPLKYSGAHTHRFSGDWKINLQNLPRDSELRRALRAPKGRTVVSIDASQIECRLNATLSGETFLMDAFAKGIDVYSWFAENIYGYPVTKDTHPKERFVGKTAVLSLGYGASWRVFQNMCRNVGDVYLTDSEAKTIVDLYRATMRQIVSNWDYARDVVLPLLAGRSISSLLATDSSVAFNRWGSVLIEKQRLILPSGNMLRYRDLRQDLIDGKWHWVYWGRNGEERIYGAKLVENVVQSLAFVHLMEVALRVLDKTQGLLWPAHQVHDEWLYVVDEHLAGLVRDVVIAEMSKPPHWMPNVPLAAEGKISVAYHPEQG